MAGSNNKLSAPCLGSENHAAEPLTAKEAEVFTYLGGGLSSCAKVCALTTTAFQIQGWIR